MDCSTVVHPSPLYYIHLFKMEFRVQNVHFGSEFVVRWSMAPHLQTSDLEQVRGL